MNSVFEVRSSGAFGFRLGTHARRTFPSLPFLLQRFPSSLPLPPSPSLPPLPSPSSYSRSSRRILTRLIAATSESTSLGVLLHPLAPHLQLVTRPRQRPTHLSSRTLTQSRHCPVQYAPWRSSLVRFGQQSTATSPSVPPNTRLQCNTSDASTPVTSAPADTDTNSTSSSLLTVSAF